ncbi:MAG: UDP-N-acetylmuramate dehydrogenase [bacterium]
MIIDNFKGELKKDEKMSNHTTWKVGGVAKYLALPYDEVDVELAVSYCLKESIRYCIIGNGSNVLFTDDNFDGMVIKTTGGLKEKKTLFYQNDTVISYFSAGNMMGDILNFSLRHGLAGLEFLSGIPATFGGVLKMNAGAFNSEIKDIIEWINFYSPEVGFISKRRNELSFSYRRLDVPKDWIILGGAVRLTKDKREAIQERINNNLKKRKETQPLNEPTCGSVFKNPKGDYAGRIIEELGLKGFQVGGAKISEKHANFIVNTGRATAKDILTLIEMIKQKVWLKKELLLEEEVVIMNKNTGSKVSIV